MPSRLFHWMSMVLLLALSPHVLTAEFDVTETPILELQAAMDNGEITSLELVDAYLARISAYDKRGPQLNSIIRINPNVRAEAAALDRERQRSGARSLLHGIPILVKDNYNTSDMPTTGGSVALAHFVPDQDATQITKLREAGAVILAKTNLHEYAYGITTVSSIVGQTRNPYDIRRVPGGSSGGTGAAVAASFGVFGLGSDTCGSIRIPAAFNNLIGLRPTKGLSSIFGVMPLSHTQDVAGPLARSAADLAIVLDIVKGYDENDAATSILLENPVPEFQAALAGIDLQGLRFGVLTEYMERASNSTQQAIEAALQWYESQGVELVETQLPELSALIGRSGLIGYEFRYDLNQYLSLFGSDAIADLNAIVGSGLYHRAVSGPLVRSNANVREEQAYAEAVAARDDLREALEQLMANEQLDLLVYPPIAEEPVFIGESQPGNNCSISANSGLPALSLPVGFTSQGLPVGMEMLGMLLDDARLLAIGYAFEVANSTRKTPSVTPRLVNGMAPAIESREIAIQQQGLSISGWTEFDQLLNEFRFGVNVGSGNVIDIAAVTLVFDEAGSPGEIQLNLLGPDSDYKSGSHYMSADFIEAYNADRLILRIFAEGLGASGLSVPLQ